MGERILVSQRCIFLSSSLQVLCSSCIVWYHLLRGRVYQVRCPLGITLGVREGPHTRKTPHTHRVQKEKEPERRKYRQTVLREVPYNLVLFLSGVVTWRTSPQTVFISFISPFPEPLALHFNFAWLALPLFSRLPEIRMRVSHCVSDVNFLQVSLNGFLVEKMWLF